MKSSEHEELTFPHALIFFAFIPYFIGAILSKHVFKSGRVGEKVTKEGWPYRDFLKKEGFKPSTRYVFCLCIATFKEPKGLILHQLNQTQEQGKWKDTHI